MNQARRKRLAVLEALAAKRNPTRPYFDLCMRQRSALECERAATKAGADDSSHRRYNRRTVLHFCAEAHDGRARVLHGLVAASVAGAVRAAVAICGDEPR
jgi:hypothetical protein